MPTSAYKTRRGLDYSGAKFIPFGQRKNLTKQQNAHYRHARSVKKAKRNAVIIGVGLTAYGAHRLNRATGAVRMRTATSGGWNYHNALIVGGGNKGRGSYWTRKGPSATIPGQYLGKGNHPVSLRYHVAVRIPKFIANLGPRDLRRVPGQLAIGPAKMHTRPYIGKINHTRRNVAIGVGAGLGIAALGGTAYALNKRYQNKHATVKRHPTKAIQAHHGRKPIRVRRGAGGKFAGSY